MAFIIKYFVDNLEIKPHHAGNSNMTYSHYHDSFEIDILEDGDRSYVVENKLYHLKPRDVLLIKPDVVHCTVGGTYVRSLVTFSGRYLYKYFSKLGVTTLTECFEKRIIRVRESDFGLLLSYVEKLAADENDFLSLVQILSILRQNMNRKSSDSEIPSSKIARIVAYVTENYKSITTLDSLAEEFLVSREHLCDLFKAYTNTTIFKYINVLKVHEATELLVKTSLPLTEIAEKSGFSSLANFSKTFKVYANVSPSEFKKIYTEKK